MAKRASKLEIGDAKQKVPGQAQNDRNRVFISWSGDTSRQVAEALKDWLPEVIEGIEPWLSTQDLTAGMRWGSELASQLERTDFGVICLTPDNLQAPWILFEAGALAKAV